MSIHIRSTETTAIFAKRAFVNGSWAENLRLTMHAGRIATLEHAAAPLPGDVCVPILLPALTNLHSHTFQRAMAGLTERRGSQTDSFWTWRNLMYQFLEVLTPDDVQKIAALAFMEMQKRGFAAVAEFHYLHHAADGSAYADAGELSKRIFAAADETGIGLTHLPVFYAYGGAGEKPLAGGQKRFGHTLDSYLKMRAELESYKNTQPSDTMLGTAPHSLRAISPPLLHALLAATPQGPLHIHIAEQAREVDEIEAWLGARPVQWLLRNAEVNRRWCLVHATHMTEGETIALAKTQGVAGLCPLTEANLGDGIFNGFTFQQAGGRMGLGTDSNVEITAAGELKMLEYSQRLAQRQRNVLAKPNASTGESLYLEALRGGAQAAGRESGDIAPGLWADLVALDENAASIIHRNTRQLLDSWIFTGGSNAVTDLWSAGRHCVQGGRHLHEESIERNFNATLKRLLDLL